jgi:hypothetical protein
MRRTLAALVLTWSSGVPGCAAQKPSPHALRAQAANVPSAPQGSASTPDPVPRDPDAGAAAELVEWGRTVCHESAVPLVARVVPQESEQSCYRYPPVRDDPCERKVAIRVANCDDFARDSFRVLERYSDRSGSQETHVWEFPGVGPEGVSVLTVPVPPAEQSFYYWVNRPPPPEHHYVVLGLSAEPTHRQAEAEADAVVRDPAFEAAQKQYCEELPASGAGEPTPPPSVKGAPKDGRELRLDRSTCFGPCPSYRVAVRTDGTVIYQGRAAVRVQGWAVDHIARTDAAALFAAFDTAAAEPPVHADPRRHCPGPNPDSPRTRVTLWRGRHEHPLPLLGHCSPPREQELATEIDRVAHTSRWVTGSNECRDRGLW